MTVAIEFMSFKLRFVLSLLIILAGALAFHFVSNRPIPDRPAASSQPVAASPPRATEPGPAFDPASFSRTTEWVMGRLRNWHELRNNVIAFEKEQAALLAACRANKGAKVDWLVPVESVARSPERMAKVEFAWTGHPHTPQKHQVFVDEMQSTGRYRVSAFPYFKAGVAVVAVPESQAADLVPGQFARLEGTIGDFDVYRSPHLAFPDGSDDLLWETSGWWVIKDAKLSKLPR